MLLAELPIEHLSHDTFEAKVPLPGSLAIGSHVIVLRAAVGSSVVAQSSVTIVVANQPPSKWPQGAPAAPNATQHPLLPPPSTIHPHLLADFTMNHTADVDYMCAHTSLPSSCVASNGRLKPRLIFIAFFSIFFSSHPHHSFTQVFLGRRGFIAAALPFCCWNRRQYRFCHAPSFLLLQYNGRQFV